MSEDNNADKFIKVNITSYYTVVALYVNVCGVILSSSFFSFVLTRQHLHLALVGSD